jgi:hypothetical protein
LSIAKRARNVPKCSKCCTQAESRPKFIMPD